MSSMYNFTGEQVRTFTWYSKWQEGYSCRKMTCWDSTWGTRPRQVLYHISLSTWEKLIKFVGILRIYVL